MKSHTAFIGAEGAVELDTKGAINVNLAFIVAPGHAKDDLSFGLANALDELSVGKLRMLYEYRPERFKHLMYGLMELRLAGVSREHLSVDRLKFFIQSYSHPFAPAAAFLHLLSGRKKYLKV
jgi:hypothetical protein